MRNVTALEQLIAAIDNLTAVLAQIVQLAEQELEDEEDNE